MKTRNVILSSLLVTSSVAQINFSSLFSDVQSVYTVVTSALGSPATSTTSTSSSTTSSSSSSTTTSSSTSSSSTSSSVSTSSASAASTPTTSAAAQSTTASAAAAASTTNTSNGNSGSGGSNTLPIVLGCTLGALALAAFLALLFLCRRRSKRSKAAAKHRDLATSDDESDIWNREKYHRNSFKGPTERTRVLGTTNNTAAAPLMLQHGHGNQQPTYGPNVNQTFYAPTHPSTTQFSSATHPQETDSTSYTAHPYSPDHIQSYGHNSEAPAGNHYRGNTLAAGVGGAALGGLAAHAADRHDARRSDSRSRKVDGVDGTYTEDEHNTLPEATMASHDRRSGSVSRASVKEPWPFMDANERRSNDSTLSRPRSISRGRDQFGMHEQEPHDRHSMPSSAALAGSAAAGGLLGAATARGAGNQSPHRKGILKQTTSNPAKIFTSPDGNSATGPTATHNSGPHELESFDIPPPVRPNRERRHSPLGTAAPVAAVGANRSPTRSDRRSWSNSSTPTNVRPTSRLHDSSQDSDIPVVPSRSPRRNSVHSNARYSTANEGTVELPADKDALVGAVHREPVSPAFEPRRASMDNEAVISPISPDTSLPGTWSKAQAEELGMDPAGLAARSSSQESTAVGYSPLNSASTSSTSSKEHSSGLVSAIQRIFNSQKQSWPVEETPAVALPRRSFGDRAMPVSENIYEDNHRVASVPHRKPAPAKTAQHRDQYDEIGNNDANATVMPGGWTNETAPLQQTESRKSEESARSVPMNGGRFYTRVNSVGESDMMATTAPLPATSPSANANMNTGRTRSTSRPGYGIGSGDPFDLARIRTDSSMTGISLANYTEPTRNTTSNTSKSANVTNTIAAARPYARRTSNPSHDYREPTLAELKREVEEEDRQRRMSWKSTGRRSIASRKSTEGQRYGNDKELFDLAFPGSEQYDHFYGQAQHSGTGVGTAY